MEGLINSLGTLNLRINRRLRRLLRPLVAWLSYYSPLSNRPLVQLHHAPARVSRRAGALSVNLCGKLNPRATSVSHRLNKGPWQPVKQSGPRVKPLAFTIELPTDHLRLDGNTWEIQAKTRWGRVETQAVQFQYDPVPQALPIDQDWASDNLDVQDGRWEKFLRDGRWWVRPTPGYEGYDRILLVCGALSGARRIELDLVYRGHTQSPFGFGVIGLWGGHPDEEVGRLRRGWRYGLGWYYSRYQGVGLEFSNKMSDAAPEWCGNYRNHALKPNQVVRLILECWPEVDADGNHRCFRQRMQWLCGDDSKVFEWLENCDTQGAALPAGEYAVALVAHRSQVEFGPVQITALRNVGK
jgi:hypothetical protein